MKRLFLAMAVVSLLISCLGGIIETEIPGMPKIENVRILGYDQSSGGYVEKYTFQSSGDWPYLEFTVYDDDIDINEITITLYNNVYPGGEKAFTFDLYQYDSPQICRYLIPITQSEDNFWYLQFFVTDINGKRSKTHESDIFKVLP